MSLIQRPKSDLGTIIVHWLIVAALLGAAITGLSIASADNPDAWASILLEFLRPHENVWLFHLGFGIALASSLIAYAVYITRAKLTDRIRINAARVRALFLRGRPRLASANVFLYWVLFAALILEIVTGALLFFGFGGEVLALHLHTTWFLLAFPFVHAAGHWLYGGAGQLLRVFNPQWRLPEKGPELVDALIERVQRLEVESTAHPLVGPAKRDRVLNQPKILAILVPLFIAIVAGIALIPFSTILEKQSRQILRIVRISAMNAPAVDGDLSHAAWRWAPVTAVLTQHGANFDGGESEVEVRALHDGNFAYFAFTWTDPTRSLKHMPLVKQDDGWHLMRSAADGKETRFHEDKFAVLLAAGGQPLIGKGIHLGHQPLSDKPESATGRGLHFMAHGVGDIWEWRASHGGMIGWIDNGHFGAPLPASSAPAGKRYPGGFALDPGSSLYQDNFDVASNEDAYPLVRPRRLPKHAARILWLTSLDLDAETSDADTALFWLAADESQPYSEELDRAIPVGAVIPSILLTPSEANSSGMSSLIGGAHWASGRWCLSLRRRLDTGSPFDVAIRTGALMWVTAFDHAETWHTYHIRPLELEVE